MIEITLIFVLTRLLYVYFYMVYICNNTIKNATSKKCMLLLNNTFNKIRKRFDSHVRMAFQGE